MTDAISRALLTLTGVLNRPGPDDALMAEAGVSLDPGLMPLLVRIGAQGPLGVVEAADLLGRDHSTVSRQVGKLEAQGLVRRTPSARDGRVRVLQVTPAGRTALDAIDGARRRLMSQALGDWSADDIAHLERLLTRLAEIAEAHDRSS